jgi:hypothetical protein
MPKLYSKFNGNYLSTGIINERNKQFLVKKLNWFCQVEKSDSSILEN